MPAKAPIYLKTSGGKNAAGIKGGKKLREILSTDMISPPLGDFRHMAHVGRGGSDDMFGDTSFLQQNKGNSSLIGSSSTRKSDSNLLNGSGAFRRGGSIGKKEKGSKKGRTISLSHEQSSTLDRFKRKKRDVRAGIMNGEDCNPEMSPLLQSAFSLPILSNDSASPSPTHEETSNESSVQSSNNNTIEKQRHRSHEGVIIDAPATTQKTPNGTGGPPKPRRIMSVKTEGPALQKGEEEPSNLGAVDKQSSLRRSSEVLTEMPDCIRKTKSQESEDDGWSFSLDLGPSLMDEIMGMMSEPAVST